MDTFEGRLAFLEGRVDEQSRGTNGLTDSIRHLDQKVDRFRDELSARIDALDQKVDRFRDELSARIDALDLKMSRQFAWTVGIQVTVLVAVMGALLVR
jgi:uncharacterized coiled-coil protein SlyX